MAVPKSWRLAVAWQTSSLAIVRVRTTALDRVRAQLSAPTYLPTYLYATLTNRARFVISPQLGPVPSPLSVLAGNQPLFMIYSGLAESRGNH